MGEFHEKWKRHIWENPQETHVECEWQVGKGISKEKWIKSYSEIQYLSYVVEWHWTYSKECYKHLEEHLSSSQAEWFCS